MSTPTLILGNNKWAIEEDNILGYAVEDRNGSYLPREISFTRGSDATFTTSTGVIRQACWNLIGYSEEFDNAYWTKSNSSITTNTETAPNGTLTADTLNITTFTYSGLYRNISGNSSNYTMSVYAKKNTKNWLYFVDIQGTAARAWFDLNNGVLGTVSSGYTATITDVGNGWYRCTLYNNSAQIPSYYQLGVSDSNNTTTPSTSGNIFIWGAQLVQESDALGYLRTTDRLNMPRVDSSTGTKAFLVEPQRTNLVLQSNTFNTTWQLFGGATITSNSTTSPEGLTNATTLNSAGGVNDFLYQSFTVNNATTYTVSFFVKNVNSTQSKFYIPLTATPEAFINWSGSTLTSVTSSGTNSFTAMSNGWYRVSITATATATGVYIFRIYSDNNNTSKSIYIYGTQLEQGAYPTSYIPTQATTVTRIADRSTMSSVSGLIGQSEGTIFAEVDYVRDSTFTPRKPISINSGSSANLVDIYVNAGDNTLTARVRANSVGYGTISITNNPTGRIKVAYAYKENDYVLYINGSSYGAVTTGGPFVFSSPLSIFQAGCGESSNDELGGRIFQSAVYTSRLTNAELAALTTL